MKIGKSISLSSNGLVVAIGSPAYKKLNWCHQFEEILAGLISGYIYLDDGLRQDLVTNFTIELGMTPEEYSVEYGCGDYIGNPIAFPIINGRVSVYRYENEQWLPQGAAIEGEDTFSVFGLSTALSADGSILAAGLSRNEYGRPLENKGGVRVFSFTNDSWSPFGERIDGVIADAFIGQSIDLSADGLTLAVAANFGAQIFKFANDRWNSAWQSSDMNSYGVGNTCTLTFSCLPTWNDWYNRSISLSADGSVVALADPTNGTGVVQVFQIPVTASPTDSPTVNPTVRPTVNPTVKPTNRPTKVSLSEVTEANTVKSSTAGLIAGAAALAGGLLSGLLVLSKIRHQNSEVALTLNDEV